MIVVRIMKLGVIGIFAALATLISCQQGVEPGDDPNFVITSHTDRGFKHFRKKVEVFDIPIYAVTSVADKNLLHAANVLAQYLDNDEDAHIDNQAVLDAMKQNNAYLVMWNKESDLTKVRAPHDWIGQDLGNDETKPGFVSSGRRGQFDATLEEVWHLVSNTGYAPAYPDVLGTQPGTNLARAMDRARGGMFEEIPTEYPSAAWFRYYEETCDYSCMVAKYLSWALTSCLGAHEFRRSAVKDEWMLHNLGYVQEFDPDVYILLTYAPYRMPKFLPDGSYQH